MRTSIALAVLGSSLFLLPGGVDAAGKPNIVFVFADQLRASATGYGGDPNVRTPNLDRLARESVNFRNAVSVCPVCTPYRASLLTGRFPTTTGMFLNDAHLPDSEITIAEVLQTAGYDTGYIGKWHLDGHGRSSFIPPERRQGFDYWKVAECDHTYNASHYYTGDSAEKKLWEGYDAFAQTADAKSYLAQHADGRPFALFVSYGIPHFPHGSAPPRLRQLYPLESIKFRDNVPENMRTDAVRREAQGYYAHTTALDECIGELLAALDAPNLRENTILVFTSDHGETMGSQGVKPCTKQVPWDESARVPFLLRAPSMADGKGRETATPLTTPDIMPTLLALAGVPAPQTVEGRDLSAVVREGRDLTDHDALYMAVSPFTNTEWNRPYRAIRTDRHTYVRGLQGPWLLFDDVTDPFQMKNLVGDPGQAGLQKKLETRLDAALKAAGDDFQPPAYYVKKFGYEVGTHGSVSYAPGAKPQSPRKAP
jgi:arylsulfatase A-like enzyme